MPDTAQIPQNTGNVTVMPGVQVYSISTKTLELGSWALFATAAYFAYKKKGGTAFVAAAGGAGLRLWVLLRSYPTNQ